MIEQASPSRHSEPQSSHACSHRLLDEVLGETLRRGAPDDEALLEQLMLWARSHGSKGFDASATSQLVAEVLRCRLGERFAQLPPGTCHDIGLVLWNDPTSRQRMGRLWQHLLTSE